MPMKHVIRTRSTSDKYSQEVLILFNTSNVFCCERNKLIRPRPNANHSGPLQLIHTRSARHANTTQSFRPRHRHPSVRSGLRCEGSPTLCDGVRCEGSPTLCNGVRCGEEDLRLDVGGHSDVDRCRPVRCNFPRRRHGAVHRLHRRDGRRESERRQVVRWVEHNRLVPDTNAIITTTTTTTDTTTAIAARPADSTKRGNENLPHAVEGPVRRAGASWGPLLARVGRSWRLLVVTSAPRLGPRGVPWGKNGRGRASERWCELDGLRWLCRVGVPRVIDKCAIGRHVTAGGPCSSLTSVRSDAM
jgi:hypothetical protein